ncbi:NAD(P)H-dependent oxidoreductase [Ligilactobacillus murinus]|uniref:NADPH-dependent FMN reductase n=1 Tax=Ligilactobacillus murinus TaxID=1622 RepID=A0AAE6WHB5_9LACO|nr:NAD(P)H-dependent oxidoreductase [Ligilactobacillus murinus]NEF85561.1 NADPH-dependent FMN reductase [Ligilactobacillus murinus]NEF89830.1 NADPH-dependent FMN reductase [Ligilactobacillus murinus]NEF94273.1 NADPH-dependent FMN reductase [Ligilactobacillus murinus]NEF96872.1 NADPH-dependent FMN reductase [Ligilactobacillus murinus]NEF98788.1 NADPH-dependent FMN reductase [Ligilactobacillus murinus]
MKFVGIVGSSAEQSYNRLLLEYIRKQFKSKFELEILEIDKVPMFNQDDNWADSFQLRLLNNKITRADGVIIATPEHNHTITAALKSVLEWLSYQVHPFESKPVMIVGASYYDQGTSRAQPHLREILDAPGVNAYTLPGNEFLLEKAKEAFDDEGNIISQDTVNFLETCLDNFIKYVEVVSSLKKPKPIAPEDLDANHPIKTTVTEVDPDDPKWVEKVAKITGAVSGDTYVKLDHGILTVDQINMFLKSMPFELTYADDNNQFLYYNNAHQEPETMLAKRIPAQSGSRLSTVHNSLPPARMKNVEWVVGTLRNGNQEFVRTIVPGSPENVVNTHHYQAMYYPDGSYAGINELVFNFKPWLDWYLKETGQRLVGGKMGMMPDVNTGASETPSAEMTPDANTGASEH